MTRAKSGAIFGPWVKLGGLYLLGLASYVLFITWDNHRRSSIVDADMSPSSRRYLLADKQQCKSISVASGGKVDFALDRERLETPPEYAGVNVVAIDTWAQTIIQMKVYDPVSQDTVATEFFSDLQKLKQGIVVMVGVKNDGAKLHKLALEALRGLGATTLQEHIHASYALIGVKGGTALAESQGSSAQASSILPCTGGYQGVESYFLSSRQLNHSVIKKSEAASEKIAEAVLSKQDHVVDADAVKQLDEATIATFHATFHATGCQNDNLSNKVLISWRREAQSTVLKTMYAYCVLTKAGDATEAQRLGCCGGTGECIPTSCTLQSQFRKANETDKAKVEAKKERIAPSSVGAAFPLSEAAASQPPIQGSPETTYRCVGGAGNRSCLFKNLYYYKGRFVMYRVQKIKDRIEVFRADKYEGLWKPEIEEFDSDAEIEKHLASKDVIEERGLSVQFNPLFHHNIGHALFDGLYPAFLATVKLQVQDRPWRPVVAVDPGCFDDSAGGELKPGDSIEAYLPHPKFTRTLRAVRSKIVSLPKTMGKESEASCEWKPGLDHGGIDLGSEGVPPGPEQRKKCMTNCALTFGCKAGVLFADICYLKGSGGKVYPREERTLCVMKGSGPKPSIVVKAEPGQGVDENEVTIPEPWVVGKIRRRCMSEDIYEMFGGVGEIRRLFEIERDARNYPNLLLRFEEVVIGVGGAGNMIADRTGAIGGSLAPHNAMRQFRDRMLRSYSLPVPSGSKPVPADEKIDVIIISNKRFQQQDWVALNDIVTGLKERDNVRVEIIDWGRIGNGRNKFKEHLKRTLKADVYISSIGTALQYVPFMRDGKTYIALGSVWMRSGQYFPTFMEQQLAGGGTPYLRTLYADPGKVLRNKGKHPALHEDGFFAGVDGPLVKSLVEKAEALVRTGFQIPVPPEENLSIEARILVEICHNPDHKEACDKMTKNRNGAVYECALLLWNEAVVYEVGPWRKGDKCGSAHHDLLRTLRKKYGLSGYGAPEGVEV